MHLRRLVSFLALAVSFGCARPFASTEESAQGGLTHEAPIEGAPWGPGCNEAHLKDGLWSLLRAPDYALSPSSRARIDQVIAEVKGSYGGTLVTAPPDDVLDTPAFLAHYLREFATAPELTPNGLASYDYRFERILDRISGAPGMLEDPRLDWDVWRAFLAYENFTDGKASYLHLNAINWLNGAKDLLWVYLEYNSAALLEDRRRLAAWIDRLTLDLHAPGGRPLRRWYLLAFTSWTDEMTSKIVEKEEARRAKVEADLQRDSPGCILSISKGNAYRPFLVVRKDNRKPGSEDPTPPFAEAIKRLAREHGLSYQVLGINPGKMPRTQSFEINLLGRPMQIWMDYVLDQESWSTEHHYYHVTLSHTIGRRAGWCNVHLPEIAVTDGVYFFTYNGRLYVWPKTRMDDAAIDMLHLCGLIDQARRASFAAQGFAPLETTLQGE